MATIRFSSGHGTGAAYNRGGLYFNEGDENYDAVGFILDELRSKYKGDFRDIRHERGNKDYSLGTRSRYGNGANLFYSWHSNAYKGKARGVEIILSYQSLDYIDFARDLCSVISDTLSIPNRGVKFKNYDTDKFETYEQASKSSKNWYGELNGNKAECAVIVEHFFHDNKYDSKVYLEHKQKLIKNIASVIAKHFNLESKTSVNDEQFSKADEEEINDFVQKWRVIDPRLNVRSEADGNSKVIGEITDKDIYTISHAAGKWGKLRYFKGWIHSDFVDVLSIKVSNRWKVITDHLYIRDNHTNGTIVGEITDRGVYDIVEQVGKWGKLKNGKGWIHSDFVDVLESRKSTQEIAKEVILGRWGNGSERKRALTQAGYDYDEVQKEVNKLV